MDVKLVLKKNNMKVTKARYNILDIICTSEKCVDVNTIFERCKDRGVDIDLSTIYRTIDLLVEKKVIEKIDLGNGTYNYTIKDNVHKHILVCNICHKEIEIECPMQQVEEIIKYKTGFTLTEHELKLKGICKNCMKKIDK